MLLLHWKSGLVHEAHEWLSLVFSAIALWHLIRNWAGLKRYFSHRPAQITFIICILISLIFTGLTAREDGRGEGRGKRAGTISQQVDSS